jgi:N-methylhydantoinase A/oxoprolinase/acetone carboxylase beta subunit
MTVADDTQWSVGVDIGGTFTDLVAVNVASGLRIDAKVLTTPQDPFVGVLSALSVAESRGLTLDAISDFVHASTLAINTLIQRTGGRIAMLTTSGFRDVIEIGRTTRYDLYDLQLDLPAPLVPRERRIGIDERMRADGSVERPLDGEGVRAAIRGLGEVDSIAVCFLHSYRNPAHELTAASIVREELPNVYVSTSADVAPMVREYERFLAAAVNSYVGPKSARYIESMVQSLAARGFRGTFGIMKSDGGMLNANQAIAQPVRMLDSGPAAGVLSAGSSAVACGERLAVAFDMGGTTAKACLVKDGESAMTNELQVARLRRFASGSGLPIRIPSLDLLEIGAGGGSIARIDNLGVLQVGPDSAGAEPGPVCYGRGGVEPTVTDADLLLGYLDADSFAGGTMRLDTALAAAAVEEKIITAIDGTDVTSAAWAIYDIVNENMARAARLHCLEHGEDPARVVLVATGGAGALHASAIMPKMGAKKVICPPRAGVASALGLLLAPRSADRTLAAVRACADLTDATVAEVLNGLEVDLRRDNQDYPYSARAWVHMRLIGQGYELRVPVPDNRSIKGLQEAFVAEYRAHFGRDPWSDRTEIVDWTVELFHLSTVAMPQESFPHGSEHSGRTRRAYFGPGYGWMECVLLDRAALAATGRPVNGPALLNESETTVVVGPGQQVWCDAIGNLHIELAGASQVRD